jgi:flagellar protein FliO/FliZ
MDTLDYFRFVLAFAFVLALIAGAALLLKRYGSMGFGGLRANRGPRRLAISEVLALDARRRLVLVRRDGVEHLILIGGTDDLVVEAGITAGPAFRDALAEAASAEPGTPLSAAQDPTP